MRLFKKEELRFIKYRLISKGMSSAAATKEVEGMIKTAEKNHKKAMREEREAKKKENARRRKNPSKEILQDSNDL